MSVPTPAIVQAMQRASALLQAGNFPLARATLEQIVQTAPRFVEAHRLLAGAWQGLGDIASAERILRHALSIDPRWAPSQAALGELLANAGRTQEAEAHLRSAVGSAQAYPRAALVLAQLLNATNRSTEVIELTAPFARAAKPDLDLLTQRGNALLALDRHDEAIAIFRQIATAVPASDLAELNLAGALDTAGEHVAAEASARRARSKGASSAEAIYLHARTLIASARYDEAEAALRESLQINPLFADAQQNLAQLIWMRGGDATAASEMLDDTLRHHPDAESLHVQKANLLLGASGDAQAAHAYLSERAQHPQASVGVLITAAQAALKFDAALALGYAQRAVDASPRDVLARRILTETLLGLGEPDRALAGIEQALRDMPNDQYLIALQTTAWRMLGDPRYAEFCDYAQMARGWVIDTPSGWPDLPSYLRDLAASLTALHTLQTHPLHQSLRHGSQTPQNLLRSDDRAIRAFFQAIDGPIRRHRQAIGHGADPLRRRNPTVGSGKGYRIKGIWSVRLRAQGYHTNHVHPEGWLSSACYIELPQAIDAPEQRQGWLKFGEPGMPTTPALDPEYFIRPEPGLLALFPSYFWHGTVPFDGDDKRLTIAFDLVPA